MGQIDSWGTKGLDFLDKASFGLSLGTKGAIATHEWRMDMMNTEAPTSSGPEVDTSLQQSSTYGVVIPRLYGRIKLGGNMFWLENNKIKVKKRIIVSEETGGKGGGSSTEAGTTTVQEAYATFALGLGIGPAYAVGRIWASDQLIYNILADTTAKIDTDGVFHGRGNIQGTYFGFSLYPGTVDQPPSERMQETLTVANTPRFPGLAYLLVKDFPLASFGNTLQSAMLKVELIKLPQDYVPTDDRLFVAGNWPTGIADTAGIAQWDGREWGKLDGIGTLPDAFVYDLLPRNGELIVVGNFTDPTNYIARWDGTAWQDIGGGLNGFAKKLLQDSRDVDAFWAGGVFTVAGGVSANRIARWNGSVWQALGGGLTGGTPPGLDVMTMLEYDGGLLVGGYFTSAGGSPASKIAWWDGAAWNTLSSGVSAGVDYGGAVWALCLDDAGRVIAGGDFTVAGGSTRNNIARWNGSSWAAMGSGMNGTVMCLATAPNGDIYAGGYFTVADGNTRNYIAKWNGTTWAAVGGGTNERVNSLRFDSRGYLYVGGYFTAAGGVPCNGVAMWDGKNWNALGAFAKDGYNFTLAHSLEVFHP